MRYLNLFLLSCLFSVSLAATTQITTFGEPYGIVSDTTEWSCKVLPLDYAAILVGPRIVGTSTSLPMNFEWHP